MTRKIDGDHKYFRDVIEGLVRKELKKFFKSSRFVGKRPRGGKFSVTVPGIDQPHFAHGESDDGIGRGPGDKGDVIKKDPEDGRGSGGGDEEGEGIEVGVSQEYILQFLKEELELPDLKPKPSETFDEIKIKYNDISLTGPESLRHTRRTMLQALKRLAASGEMDKLHYIPGSTDPVKLITPINSDRRYRQYREIKLPSSNAVIMFGRDGSYSMDDTKCDIVNDTAWWIDFWVRSFYEKVERCYFWHDVSAREVDEEKFYKYRFGGGTKCSSCLELMAKQLEDRFSPAKWNIYCFYFSDGENQMGDNEIFVKTIKEKFPPEICNLFGIVQVLAWNYTSSLKAYVDENLEQNNLRTTSIGTEENTDPWAIPDLSGDQRNEAIKKAIKDILGKKEASQMMGTGI